MITLIFNLSQRLPRNNLWFYNEALLNIELGLGFAYYICAYLMYYCLFKANFPYLYHVLCGYDSSKGSLPDHMHHRPT